MFDGSSPLRQFTVRSLRREGHGYSASFDDIASDFDELFGDVEEVTRLEALSVHGICGPRGIHTILDCACGTGIQSIGLSKLGYQVYASDLSRKMLRLLRKKAAAKGLKIETKWSDFRNLQAWKGMIFDAVICCGNSLTLAKNGEEILASLRSMRAATKASGGLVIIGLHNYPLLKRRGQTFYVRRAEIRGERALVVLELRFFGTKRVTVVHVLLRMSNGKMKAESYMKSYVCLSPHELRGLMLDSGFPRVELVNMQGLGPFQRREEWALAVGLT